MKMNTRLVFKILLRRFQADGVFDVGSCDGYDSVLFRQILPKAVIVAFEANPINYQKMAANETIRANRIEVLPYAITNRTGTAQFNVVDVDYENPQENRGTSSLLVHESLKIREVVEVETRRLDEIVLKDYSSIQRLGLWIDVEGAEFGVLESIAGVKDRVVAAHVETARSPLRLGQRVFSDVEALMKSLGFSPVGTNMSESSTWGDVVFVNEKAVSQLGWRFRLCCWMSMLTDQCRLDSLGLFLRQRCQPLYHLLRRIYFKLFT
ncbi:MAG: FkbM family methyltransferase [Verrucomicrobia bacterium]|nr:FkbM family methyltransferase [Verrucomicrobiota bacterium]